MNLANRICAQSRKGNELYKLQLVNQKTFKPLPLLELWHEKISTCRIFVKNQLPNNSIKSSWIACIFTLAVNNIQHFFLYLQNLICIFCEGFQKFSHHREPQKKAWKKNNNCERKCKRKQRVQHYRPLNAFNKLGNSRQGGGNSRRVRLTACNMPPTNTYRHICICARALIFFITITYNFSVLIKCMANKFVCIFGNACSSASWVANPAEKCTGFVLMLW